MLAEKINLKENINIFYETKKQESPNAKWVTLINGHMRTTKDFTFVTRKLVENGFSVISFDSRGAGRTIYENSFTLEDIKDDCLYLWDKLQILKSHLIGFSMGGMIAQLLAQSHPQRLDHLIFVSTCFRREDLKASSASWPEDLQEIKDRLSLYFSEEFLKKNALLVDAMAKNFLQEIIDGNFNVKACQQRKAIDAFDEKKLEMREDIPVHIIHGSRDQIAAAETVPFGKTRYPRAQVHWHEGAGHLLLAEAGSKLIEDLIKGLL